jgi:hypothetical protein
MKPQFIVFLGRFPKKKDGYRKKKKGRCDMAAIAIDAILDHRN